MLSVIMLNVTNNPFMLSVVLLNVVAPLSVIAAWGVHQQLELFLLVAMLLKEPGKVLLLLLLLALMKMTR
jgi:hypothetical protein